MSRIMLNDQHWSQLTAIFHNLNVIKRIMFIFSQYCRILDVSKIIRFNSSKILKTLTRSTH